MKSAGFNEVKLLKSHVAWHEHIYDATKLFCFERAFMDEGQLRCLVYFSSMYCSMEQPDQRPLVRRLAGLISGHFSRMPFCVRCQCLVRCRRRRFQPITQCGMFHVFVIIQHCQCLPGQ